MNHLLITTCNSGCPFNRGTLCKHPRTYAKAIDAPMPAWCEIQREPTVLIGQRGLLPVLQSEPKRSRPVPAPQRITAAALPRPSGFDVASSRIAIFVADRFGLRLGDLVAPNRHKTVALARHLAMWAIRARTGASYPEIGAMFNRDHTTVMSSVRRVEALIGRGHAATVATSQALAAELDQPEPIVAEPPWPASIELDGACA